jgi:hypothetical protein
MMRGVKQENEQYENARGKPYGEVWEDWERQGKIVEKIPAFFPGMN